MTIADLRTIAGRARLDGLGFELVPFTTATIDIYDPVERKAVYEPEMAALVRSATGASRVIVFNHFLRGEEAQRRDPGAITAPASVVHVDYTHNTGTQYFDSLLGNDADALRGRRFALINVWRPISGPLRDRPLALCDAGSVSSDDLMVCRTVSRIDQKGIYRIDGEVEHSEIYSVAWNPAHRWYYARDMEPTEALLIKCYDSEECVSRFAPHAAFPLPNAQNVLPRASIEVRTLAVW
jgi:hypothetical protein